MGTVGHIIISVCLSFVAVHLMTCSLAGRERRELNRICHHQCMGTVGHMTLKLRVWAKIDEEITKRGTLDPHTDRVHV
jgi:hypothetical protein